VTIQSDSRTAKWTEEKTERKRKKK